MRLWDIRRSGCLLVFDQFYTATPAAVKSGPRTSSGYPVAAASLSSSTASVRRDVTSHSASVSHIAFTPSSCRLLSLGTDSRLRVWDAYSGRHLLVHFPQLQCRYRYSRFDVQQQMAGLGQQGERVWLGSGRDVRELPVTGGSGSRHVAHFDRVNVVAVNGRWDEVYSAGVDHSILAWQRQHSRDDCEHEEGEVQQQLSIDEESANVSNDRVLDEDDWSRDQSG